MLGEATEGVRHLRGEPGLVALLALSSVMLLGIGMVQVLFTPLVLGFGDSRTLGVVNSLGGVGFITGSLVLTALGVPRRLVLGWLGFTLLQGLLLLLGGAQPSLVVASLGAFGVLFTYPVISGYGQTLWQRLVPVGLQGRVFAVRSMAGSAVMMLATVLAGPLADLLEPLMAPTGALASTAGALLGTGQGRGAALLIVALGVVSIFSVALGGLYRPLRRLEERLEQPEPQPMAPVQGA